MKKVAQSVCLLLAVIALPVSAKEGRSLIWLEAYDKVDVRLLGLPVVKLA